MNLRIKKKVKIMLSRDKHVAPESESHRVDRITSLPDCIKSNILSRLVAEEAVRTSVLSRDWKYKWTSIDNVDITIEYKNETRLASSNGFVDRLLDSNPDLNLRLFRLNLFCGFHDSYHMERWISKALGRSVKKLQIQASNTEFKIVLDRPTSLTRLSFFTQCSFMIRIEHCFPSLKYLYLCSPHIPVKIVNEQSPKSGELSLTFPVLEQLELHYTKFVDVEFVTINAPRLTSFKNTPPRNFTNYVIKIFAPKLGEFQSDGDTIDSIVLHAASLHSIALEGNVGRDTELMVSRIFPLLRGAPGLKCLHLSCDFIEALVEWKGVHAFPIFDRLEQLTVSSSCSNASKCSGLRELLQATPNLKSLTLDVYKCFPNLLKEPLPLCIMSQLKQVHICRSFRRDVANFFLENAKKLKRVYIYPSWEAREDGKIASWIRGLGPESLSRVKAILHLPCVRFDLLQQPLPRCILSRLECTRFHGFSAERRHFDVTNLLLENAKRLKKMYIYPDWVDKIDPKIDPWYVVPKEAKINSWIRKLGPEISSRVKIVRE